MIEKKSEKKGLFSVKTFLLGFVLRWIYGTKLRFHVVWQCRWSFGGLWQLSCTSTSALKIVGSMQPIDHMIITIPIIYN